MPAADAGPESRVVLMAQNAGRAPKMPKAATLKAIIFRIESSTSAAAISATPAMKAGTAICRRRSFCASERLAQNTMLSEATTYGIAATKPVCTLLRPNDLTIWGRKKPTPKMVRKKPKAIVDSSHTWGLKNTCATDRWLSARRSRSSAAMRWDSQRRSSADSQAASAGSPFRCFSAMNPRMTAGSASRMNIHCQPCRPITPSRFSSTPEIGAPITVDIGAATSR
ncbi:hypothetical protein D3C81_1578030 [compost metagenome]